MSDDDPRDSRTFSCRLIDADDASSAAVVSPFFLKETCFQTCLKANVARKRAT